MPFDPDNYARSGAVAEAPGFDPEKYAAAEGAATAFDPEKYGAPEAAPAEGALSRFNRYMSTPVPYETVAANTKAFREGLEKPLLNLPRLPDFSKLPQPDNTFSTDVPALTPTQAAGLYNAAAPAVSALTSPENLAIAAATGGLGLEAKAGSTLAKAGLAAVGAGFGGAMAVDTVKLAQHAKEVLADPKATEQEQVEAVAKPVVSGAMSLAAVAGAGRLTAGEAIPRLNEAFPDLFWKKSGVDAEQFAATYPSAVRRVASNTGTPEDVALVQSVNEAAKAAGVKVGDLARGRMVAENVAWSPREIQRLIPDSLKPEQPEGGLAFREAGTGAPMAEGGRQTEGAPTEPLSLGTAEPGPPPAAPVAQPPEAQLPAAHAGLSTSNEATPGGAGATETVVGPETGKGKTLRFGARPDGGTDLVDAIQDVGGVPRKPADATGGEWDGHGETFKGGARLLLGKGSGNIDTWLHELTSAYPQFAHLRDDPQKFYDEVTRTLDERSKLKRATAIEEQTGKFMDAALEGKGRGPADGPKAEPLPVDSLTVGTTFEVKREPFKVTDINPDTGAVTVKDGPRFGTQELPAGAMLHTDANTLEATPHATEFLNPMPPNAPTAPGAPGGGELFPTGEVPFNLASETQATGGRGDAGTGRQGEGEMFPAEQVRSTAPTALDKANEAARAQGAPGAIESNSMARGAPRATTAKAPGAPAPAATPTAPLTAAPRPGAIVQQIKQVQAIAAPQTIDDPARWTANLIRELNARKATTQARADDALRPMRNSFDQTPVLPGWTYQPGQPLPRNYAFIDAYESGNVSKLPANERAAAAEMAVQNADWVNRVHALGTGALKTLIANWFPHLWDNPRAATDVIAKLIAKKPLEGPKSFLRQRTHQLWTDGLAAGLKPAHDNPVDMWLLKKEEVERYILARQFFNLAKTAGYVKFKFYAKPMPDGWTVPRDPAFVQWGPPTVPVKEAFDATMRATTLDVLQKLGVPHERLVNLRTWGVASHQPGVPGTEEIKSKFGGPDFVLFHELGHVLDYKYPDLRTTLFGGTPAEVASARAAKNFGHAMTPAKQTIIQRDDELRALADARSEQQPPNKSFQKYLRKTPEKMAVVLQAYLHAPAILAKLAPGVKAGFETFLKAHPELAIIDDIKPSLTLGEDEAEQKVNGLVKLGDWIMPSGAARVVDNYLSPGLNPQLWYRTARGVSNVLNAAQLSMSAFHLGFTTLDAMASRMELAINAAAHGELLTAARHAATTPLSPFTTPLRGYQYRKAVLANSDPALIRALEQAGGRIGMDKFWTTSFERRTRRAIGALREQIKSGQWLGGASSALKATVNAAFVPLEKQMGMIHRYVAWQKLGVFSEMAAQDLARLGPGAKDEDVREVLRKAWDSVDNRMGQVVYDNYFYNKTLKDVALLSFRAFGWQQGKYIEGVGGVADAARYFGQAGQQGAQKLLGNGPNGAKGTNGAGAGGTPPPEWTHRMGYILALPITVGLVGAMLHYLMTGKRPETARDAFQPRTGEKDANGNDVRMNLPGYMKDVFAMRKHPVTTVAHSLNPAASAMFDLLANRDFYDTQIRNPDDPLLKQGGDIAKWAGGEATPFSVSGAQQLAVNAAPAWKQVAPFFGLTPVPMRQTMTPAQELAAETFAASMPKEAMTQQQADRSKLVRDVVKQMKSGQSAAGATELANGVKTGALNPDASALVMSRMLYNPLQFQVHHLEPEAAMRVWRVANEAERGQIRGLISVKVANSQSLTAGQKTGFLSELGGK